MSLTYILVRTFAGKVAYLPPIIDQLKYCHAYYKKNHETLPPLAGSVAIFESSTTSPLWLTKEGKKLLDALTADDHLIVPMLTVFGATAELRCSLAKRLRDIKVTVHLSDYCRYSGMLDERVLTGILLEQAARGKPVCKQSGPPKEKLKWG